MFAILDEDHNVVMVDMATWVRWDRWPQSEVGKDYVGPAWISTVFLSLDHGFWGTPLWFETAVFVGHDIEIAERYSTWTQAINGHAAAVSAACIHYHQLLTPGHTALEP